MELRHIMRIFARRWWLIAIPVVIAAVLALPDVLNRGATSGGYASSFSYTAFQDMDAIPRENGDYQDLWLSSELAVNAFTDWVRGSAFRDAVAADLAAQGLSINAGAMGIAADNARSVGQVFLSYPEGPALNQIQAAAIRVLEIGSSEVFPQLGGVDADVTILHNAEAAPAPPSLPNRFAPVIKILIGLLAGIGLVALAYYLDPQVRETADLADSSLPLLGVIPRYRA